MNTRNLILLTLIASAARADFSYVMTSKGGPGAGNETKHYLKGQKIKTDSGASSIMLDFDSQTITTINNTQKTYTVTKFSDVGQGVSQTGMEMQAEVKETGQRKTINGFNASQIVMTMQVDNPQMKQQGMKMAMEMEVWISPDVPGAGELRTFYQRNAAKFPWSAMGGGSQGNPGMQAAMADFQKRMSAMNGVTVLQVIHMKPSGGAAQAQAQAAQSDPRMAQARAKMEEMAKSGGPGAEIAKQRLASMGGAMSAGGGMEITMESSNFSTGSIPDSVFAIPAGYRQSTK